MATLTSAEAGFFRALNTFVEPVARAGWASPGIFPTGLVLLETTGRRSGRPHRVPVLATEIDGHLLISTVLGTRAAWVKNVRRTPTVRCWVRGREREAHALLFAPGAAPPATDGLPAPVRCIAASFHSTAGALGAALAVLALHD